MKKCNTCGEMKPMSDYPLASGKPRAQCKPCRVAVQTKRRIERKAELKAIAEAEAAARNEEYLARQNVALPRNYVTTEVWVPNDRAYYRNNGLKHTQSRGV